jgi:hypothetical protein
MPNEKKIEAEEILITGTDTKSYILVKPRGKHGYRSEWTYYHRKNNKNIVEGAIESWVKSGNERKLNDDGIDVTGNYISPMAYAEHIRKYLESNGLPWGKNDTYYVLNKHSTEMVGEGGLQIVGLKPVADGDNPSTLRKKRTMKDKDTIAPTVKKPTLAPQSTSSLSLPPPPPAPTTSSSLLTNANSGIYHIKHLTENKAEYVLDGKFNTVYNFDDFFKFETFGGILHEKSARGGFKLIPIGYIVSNEKDDLPGFREEWSNQGIIDIIHGRGKFKLNDKVYPHGIIVLKEQYRVRNEEKEGRELNENPITYNGKTYIITKYPDEEDTYAVYTNDGEKYIGEMYKQGNKYKINIQEWSEGYDKKFDERHSEYPYEIITTYQENDTDIDMYNKMKTANNALTQDQRDNGWIVGWEPSSKTAYYLHEYFNTIDEYEGKTNTETKLDAYDIIYEPFDVNSLPNYDGMMSGPLPSNNSKKAVAEAPQPSGWTKHFSKSKQRYYWFNKETGKSSWNEPTSGGKKNRKSKRKLNKKSKRKTKKN